MRVSGSTSKSYRHCGAIFHAKVNSDIQKVTRGCPALLRAFKQSVTGVWKVAKARSDHQNCVGGTNTGMRTLLPETAAIVEPNIVMRHTSNPGLFSLAAAFFGSMLFTQNRLYVDRFES